MGMKVRIFLMQVALLTAIWLPAEGALAPKYLNEWMFDQDEAGETLSSAINSGTEGAGFSVDSAGITQTDGIRHLVCSNDVTDSIGLYENGAVLRANVTPPSVGQTLFLRYDLEYDMSSGARNAGTLLGLGFSDGISTNLAGVALKYDNYSANSLPPPGVQEVTVPGVSLELSGSLSVIAGVNLANQTMSVWYDLSGNNTFNSSPDMVVSNLNLAAIQDLVFRATGDLLHTSSNECVRVDNIRTADSWADISEPVVDLTASPVLSASLISELGGSMAVGQTNQINVVISNFSGIASNVMSILSHDGGSGLSIISSNNSPLEIGGGRSVTQTFFIVANELGAYNLSALVSADGGLSVAAESLSLLVGKRISFDSYSISNEGGVLSGQIEPGEFFDLTVTSINDGGSTVSGITNHLEAVDSAYLTVLSNKTSQVYETLAAGETTSTVYRIACSVDTPNGAQSFILVNRTGGMVWTNYFDVNVFRQAELSWSQSNLTVYTAPGTTGTAYVVLSNIGNAGSSFSVTFDGREPGAYQVEPSQKSLFSFAPAEYSPDTVFDTWDGTETERKDIGFDFTLEGMVCDRFSVSQNGYLTLWSGLNSVKMAPFENDEAPVDQSTVRFQQLNDRLVVAWNNGENLEFQAWLYKDGALRYLYQYGTWGVGRISAAGQNTSYIPGTVGNDGLLLTPQSWVVCTPLSGFLAGSGDSQELVFSAVAPADRAAGTNVFSVTVTGDETSAPMDVTVIVQEEMVKLDLPASVSFSGPAGYISSPAILEVTNSGTVALSYVITDFGLQDASFAVSSVPYQWEDIPWAEDYMVDSSKLDGQLFEIGFPFVFFGNTYTDLVIGIDGSLLLGGRDEIVPFSGGVSFDDNSSVRMLTDVGLTRCVVTWENVKQSGGGEDQTFQAVLCRDGGILFNYRQLTGNWPDAVIELMTDAGAVVGSLSSTSTVVTTTNIIPIMAYQTNWIGNAFTVDEVQVGVETNILTEFVETVNRQSLQFSPGRPRIISFIPAQGSIHAGGTALIKLRGDARSLSPGGSEDVDESTVLNFACGPLITNYNVNVTFSATNSVETSYSLDVTRAAWGTEELPLICSEQNEDGFRTLSWPAAQDELSRRYNILFATRLDGSWLPLATVSNTEHFIDTQHAEESVIFYKVTVE